MKKNYADKVNRKAFVQLSIDNPKVGARVLSKKSKELSKSKNTSQTVKILSDLLKISERTIYNDYTN